MVFLNWIHTWFVCQSCWWLFVVIASAIARRYCVCIIYAKSQHRPVKYTNTHMSAHTHTHIQQWKKMHDRKMKNRVYSRNDCCCWWCRWWCWCCCYVGFRMENIITRRNCVGCALVFFIIFRHTFVSLFSFFFRFRLDRLPSDPPNNTWNEKCVTENRNGLLLFILLYFH